MQTKIGKTKVFIIKDDIVKQSTEAIVNAASATLLGGGGVDGAIHRAGGPKILDECRQIRARQGGCPIGNAVMTSGGKLKSNYVIHTVGPIWYGGTKNEPELLRNCYSNTLRLAVDSGIKSISFPSISTGVYGYPIEKASVIALSTVGEFLSHHMHEFSEVRFILFSDDDLKIYETTFKTILKDLK